MGERVNIQYSVDIDDLGGEVCRLMHEAFENLNAVNDGVPELVPREVMSLQTIKEIDEIRHVLRAVDERLNDAVNIINGYVSYKSEMISQEGIAAQVEHTRAHENGANLPDYDSMTETLTSLQERIGQFKSEDEANTQG